MKHACGLLIVVLLAATLGCEHDKYEIEMTTEKDSIHRKLTVSRTGDSNVADERVAELAKLYEKHAVDAEEETHVFEGTFKGRTPSDVGGAGSLTHFDTKMGNLSIYVERFRGDDDLLGQVQRRLQAADRCTDLLIGWLAKEWKDHKEFPKLRAFLDKDFRKDLKNLSLYAWRGDLLEDSAPDSDEKEGATVARMAQYLYERGYFRREDLPTAVRIFADSFDPNKAGRADKLLRIMLKAKAKISDEKFLQSFTEWLIGEQGEKSLAAYLRNTKEYKARLAEYRKGKLEDPELTEPDPLEVAGELVLSLIDAETHEVFPDELRVGLIVPAEPFLTNGKWDPETQKVTWSGRIQRMRRPTVLYALWVKPNENFQKKHFGKVVFEGEALAQYCLWRKSLTRKEAETWDEFVASLRPGENFARQVEAFQQDETKAGYLREMSEEILQALEEEGENDAEQPASRPAASTRPK